MRKRNSIPESFWSKVAIGSTEECWMWLAFTDHGGYGKFRCDLSVWAHRVAWILTNGPMPAGKIILHSCDVRACVNPSHLRLGTAQENSSDCVSKKRHYFGERHSKAILTEELVRFIRLSDKTPKELSDQLGFSLVTISQARTGRTWKQVDTPIKRCRSVRSDRIHHPSNPSTTM